MYNELIYGYGNIDQILGFGAELYWNFGIPGIVVGYFLLGFAVRRFDDRVEVAPDALASYTGRIAAHRWRCSSLTRSRSSRRSLSITSGRFSQCSSSRIWPVPALWRLSRESPDRRWRSARDEEYRRSINPTPEMTLERGSAGGVSSCGGAAQLEPLADRDRHRARPPPGQERAGTRRCRAVRPTPVVFTRHREGPAGQGLPRSGSSIGLPMPSSRCHTGGQSPAPRGAWPRCGDPEWIRCTPDAAGLGAISAGAVSRGRHAVFLQADGLQSARLARCHRQRRRSGRRSPSPSGWCTTTPSSWCSCRPSPSSCRSMTL